MTLLADEIVKLAGLVTAIGTALAVLYRGHVLIKRFTLARADHDRLIQSQLGHSVQIGEQNAAKLRFIEGELRTNGGSSVKDLLLKLAARQDVSDQIRRTLIEDREICLFETDEKGLCVWVNSTYARLIGMPASSFLEHGWVNAIHPDDREASAEEWAFAVEQRREWRGELRYLTTDGRVLEMHGSAIPLRSGNKVVGYFGQLTRLTEET